MFKRIVLTFASFWLAGVVALVVMSDPGAMSNPDSIVMLPCMAVVGMFVGPITFVAGVHGLMFGYGSGVPTPWALEGLCFSDPSIWTGGRHNVS